jgi:alpha-D-xyloside xylohydrolase
MDLETGQAIDYYFFLGSPDAVIQSYRAITGQAPMMPRWFWGFWQCKERYASQEELTGVVAKYRERKEPLDGVVQDWQYWKKDQWGSHEFDPVRYPDPAGMVSRLHAMNAHMMISVWSRFDVGTANAQELDKAGAIFPAVKNVYPLGEGRWYDPFNADGRRLYWKQMSERLFKLGVDGWWLDATEPEIDANLYRGFKTAEGPGAAVFNAYPLMTTTAVYSGQRAETDKQRVVILTRSAYAGQQRNAAVTWSGDINGSWEVFRKQIPAGLNFSISGVPYWNTDIGGFFSEKPTNKQYQELFTRWFQFGAFNPMFRVHGTGAAKEIWQWDEPTQKIWSKYVGLRYRLLPYMYSVSWQVTNDGGTMLRPLVMDFASDPQVLKIGDQFLFGPAVMVSPVTEPGAVSRSVYLPGKAAWYDFWTGRKLVGRRISAPAPIDVLPLAVRAGAIIPLGPSMQYAGEKPADPIELRVYRGANGDFTLYEDENDTYNYEKGVYATIPMHWDDAKQTLTIGDRQGKFPGMLEKRTFRVVFVGENHGTGVGQSAKADKVVEYTGKQVVVGM